MFVYVTFVFGDNYPIQVTETIMAHMLMLMTHQTGNGSRSQRVRLKISGGVKVVQLTAVAAVNQMSASLDREVGASILVMMGGNTISATLNADVDQYLYNLKKQPIDQFDGVKCEYLTT